MCCDFIYTFAEKLRKVTKLQLSSGQLANGPDFLPCVSSVAQGWGKKNLGFSIVTYIHERILPSLGTEVGERLSWFQLG